MWGGFVLTLLETGGNCFFDSTAPDCRLCICDFFKFRTTLLLLDLCYLLFYYNLFRIS